MLVSSMNFVNNVKFSDFIISKITEEQHQIDSLRREKFGPEVEKEKPLSQECIGAELEEAPSFKDCISIETDDGYRLMVDHSSLQVTMKKQEQLSKQCIFRRLDLECTENENQKMVAFQSVLDPSYFLATTPERHLELQSYCMDTFCSETRDDRVFVLFEIKEDIVFISPLAHKGSYFHHLDNMLAVRPLDINLRPPEEFYLRIREVPNNLVHASLVLEQEKAKVTLLQKQQNVALLEPEVAPEVTPKVYRKGSKKIKNGNVTPITPKPSFLSCFGVRSKSKKKDKNKR